MNRVNKQTNRIESAANLYLSLAHLSEQKRASERYDTRRHIVFVYWSGLYHTLLYITHTLNALQKVISIDTIN